MKLNATGPTHQPLPYVKPGESWWPELRRAFDRTMEKVRAIIEEQRVSPRSLASLIGDREPIVLFRQLPGMGSAKRYIIAIADDDRLDKLCKKLTTVGSTCDVMRNQFGP